MNLNFKRDEIDCLFRLFLFAFIQTEVTVIYGPNKRLWPLLMVTLRFQNIQLLFQLRIHLDARVCDCSFIWNERRFSIQQAHIA